MTDFIEQDALHSTHETPPIRDHPVHEIKSIVRTPRMDRTFFEKVRGLVQPTLKPGIHIVHKDNERLRHMFLVTSNSYEDRDNETITTKALEDYEASCFPGEGLFHCDNPMVFWHDDDVPMGEIIAVNVSGPFLIELVKELDTPLAKFLWDIAEETKDAGVSHRFGYLEKDRDPDGTFNRIFKQETSWLPRRDLAANELTYAGVMEMASPQSDKWLDEQLERLAGIKNAAAKVHAHTGEIEKELEARGLSHKAFPPAAKKPIAKPDAVPMEADAVVADDAAVVADENAVMDDNEAKDEAGASDGTMDLTRFMVLMNGMLDMLANMIDNESVGQTERMGMMKALDELKEARVSEKAQTTVTTEALMEKFKALEQRQAALETRLSLAPRSVQQQVGSSDPEFAKKQVSEAIDGTEKARKDANIVSDPFWGDLKPLPKG